MKTSVTLAWNLAIWGRKPREIDMSRASIPWHRRLLFATAVASPFLLVLGAYVFFHADEIVVGLQKKWQESIGETRPPTLLPDESIHEFRARQITRMKNIWKADREYSVTKAREAYVEFYERQSPAFQNFLDIAGYALPGSREGEVLITTQNNNWVVALSSHVFRKSDDLPYRPIPNTDSVWLDLHLDPSWTLQSRRRDGFGMYFLIPNRHDVMEAVEAAGLSRHIVPGTKTRTNALGFRGPDPLGDAKHRILVIGDSFMMGPFLAEQDTPAAQLEEYLVRELNESVSVLNGGVNGYGAVEYYEIFMQQVETFDFDVLVVSVCSNDLATDSTQVIDGGGNNWEQALFFFQRIKSECFRRGKSFVFCPVTEWGVIMSKQNCRSYHDRLKAELNLNFYQFATITADLVAEDLKRDPQLAVTGRRSRDCELYAIDGDHYSRHSAQIWAKNIGRLIVPMLKHGGRSP